MKQFYNVKCRRCGKSIRWDRLNPQACKCGSRAAIYRRRIVCIDDTRVALGKADRLPESLAVNPRDVAEVIEILKALDMSSIGVIVNGGVMAGEVWLQLPKREVENEDDRSNH